VLGNVIDAIKWNIADGYIAFGSGLYVDAVVTDAKPDNAATLLHLSDHLAVKKGPYRLNHYYIGIFCYAKYIFSSAILSNMKGSAYTGKYISLPSQRAEQIIIIIN
jgi:hypothetical protein